MQECDDDLLHGSSLEPDDAITSHRASSVALASLSGDKRSTMSRAWYTGHCLAGHLHT